MRVNQLCCYGIPVSDEPPTEPGARPPGPGQRPPESAPQPPGAARRQPTPATARRAEGEESLAEAFWAVAHQLRRLTRETLGPWEITPGQSRALGVLMRRGPMRLSVLSEHLRIAPRSTTEVVDALEERALVRRRPDPDDRRATLVSLTEQGIEVGTAIASARHAEAERLFGALSAQDRADLARILGTLRR